MLCAAPGGDLAATGTLLDKPLTALGWALHRNHADVAAFLRSRGAP